MRSEQNNSFHFDSIHYPFYKKAAIRVEDDGIHSIQDYCNFINDNKIEQANIVVPELGFLSQCPSLRHLKICPSQSSSEDFSFSPLYEHPELLSLHCRNRYGSKNQYLSTVDFSKIKGLVELSVEANEGALNFNRIDSLKSLLIGGFEGKYRNLCDMFSSEIMDTLQLMEGKIKTLDGIERSRRMQCLYLYYNRSLQNISALEKVKNSLRALRIENCPKIEDFSVLAELENLELLELSGSGSLPSLSFLKSMKNLKTFVFNMNVLDGDLYDCLNLSYVYSEKNRKHYNLNDVQLPKGVYVRGNETIEEWRRLE